MQFQAIFRQFPALNFFKHCQTKVNFTWKDKHFNFAGASERLKKQLVSRTTVCTIYPNILLGFTENLDLK